jgi:lysozyme
MYERLKQQLLRDEGEKLKPYKDTVGKTTIGVGRNLDDVGISHNESMVLLDNDVTRSANALFAALPWAEHLDDARQGALLNMAFNMGLNSLLNFKQTLALIQGEKWDDAAKAMLQSKWATQVGKRAERLSEQMRTGEWQ